MPYRRPGLMILFKSSIEGWLCLARLLGSEEMLKTSETRGQNPREIQEIDYDFRFNFRDVNEAIKHRFEPSGRSDVPCAYTNRKSKIENRSQSQSVRYLTSTRAMKLPNSKLP